MLRYEKVRGLPPRRKEAVVPGTVVVGFVDSPAGKAALEAAVEEVGRRGARLVLVNSAHGGRHEDGEHVLAIRDAVEAARQELEAGGVDLEVLEFARGKEPTEDLLEVARERQADLIVIGLRRRSAVGKVLLGSNSQSILLEADCPVLAVKAAPTH
jgi:nucleotide-binding universal stress UspA family protein